MSKKSHEIINDKDIKKLETFQNKSSNNKRNVNKLINPRNKTSFQNNKRSRIQINTKEEDFIERKSYNNELNFNNNINNKVLQNEKDTNNYNIDNNLENTDKLFLDENEEYEKPQNAIELSDLIGEKCPLDLDILSINFNNYESSKTSSKKMGFIHAYAANTYQGLVRNYNEDRVSIIINMAKPKNYTKEYWPKTSFFGIYDGHGGNKCAEFLRDNLHKLILNDISFPENVELAIKDGFKNAEKIFFNEYALDQTDKNNILDRSGSCAVITLFVDEIIYVANVGDSRAIISEKNGNNYLEITEDHKPNNPKEKIRIVKNGGHVYQSQTIINGAEKENLNGQILLGPYRVLPGRLSVSRTIGDIEAKYENFGGNPNVIICEPDIFIYDLNKNKIDFFIMGCDGIFDQMSNDEIIDCAWMILNNNKNIPNKDKNINLEKDNDNEENKVENIEYNFENCNIHKKCGIIVDFIMKASMVRKSFDNVTCLVIALNDFIKKEKNDINKNEKKDIKNNTNIKSKKSSQLINKSKKELIKNKKSKISDNNIFNHNNIMNDLNKDNNKFSIINKAKENIKLNNFINSRDIKSMNDSHPKTFRNKHSKLNNNYNSNTHNINNNKIYIKKRKERNLEKKKTNKTETTMNADRNTSNKIIKKILIKSQLQEEGKIEINNINNNKNNNDKNYINDDINKIKNKIIKDKDKLNNSQSQNGIINNYNSPVKPKNNSINYNSNTLTQKFKHNKINKIPFQLNNKMISNINKNNINNINVHFYYTSTGQNNNYKKLPNIKINSIGNNSNINQNQNISHTMATSVENNNLNFQLKPKKLKNMKKPKTFRYSNNGLNPYKEINNNNIYNGNKGYYNNNSHNISDNNNNSNNYLYLHNYSNNLENKSNKRGSMSSKKKKYSYYQIIKTLTMSVDNNNSQNKNKQLSKKKLPYSKEKDIQNFLYKNKTNIKTNGNENSDTNKKFIYNKFSKLTMKTGRKKK